MLARDKRSSLFVHGVSDEEEKKIYAMVTSSPPQSSQREPSVSPQQEDGSLQEDRNSLSLKVKKNFNETISLRQNDDSADAHCK
jgi:hypothetical protein